MGNEQEGRQEEDEGARCPPAGAPGAQSCQELVSGLRTGDAELSAKGQRRTWEAARHPCRSPGSQVTSTGLGSSHSG